MSARRSLTLFLSAVALLPAACGGDEANTVDNPGQPSPENAGEPAEDTGSGGATAQGTVEIVMKDFKFEPSTAKVKVGQEISWRNEDDAQHDAFSEESGLDTNEIGQGQTVEYTPEKAGTINYICSIHPRMKGTLEIADQ
jgi:plastocyanin